MTPDPEALAALRDALAAVRATDGRSVPREALARLELDAQHAPGQRRRDHEAIAHARLALLVERHLEPAAHHLGQLDRQRTRRERQRQQHDEHQRQAAPHDDALPHRHALTPSS